MINSLKFYTKMGYQLLSKDVINQEDYKEAYNKVAKTYSSWLYEMGKFTDEIIRPELLTEKKTIEILDFACGTGYITKKLLEKKSNVNITAVDISVTMLESISKLDDDRVSVVVSDGINYLENTSQKFDSIYCGWALPYFNHKILIKLFGKVLNQNGQVSIITNSQGTLHKVENIFMKVMKENQNEINKPMNLRFNLPNGKEGLERWFSSNGFRCLDIQEEEVVFSFDKPEELYYWLTKTGVIAGTGQIFKNVKTIENKLIEEIEKQKYDNGKYTINHKFAYGVFKKL